MPLASLTKLVPVTQILFGSDYPYRTGEDHVKGLMEYSKQKTGTVELSADFWFCFLLR